MIRKIILAALLVLPTFLYAGEKIDINTASAEALAEAIKGVGKTKAEAIVAYRQEHGSFDSIDELALVRGIGEKTVEINRENLTVESLATE
ncbi:MAG TPA: helix-hairpin-helix domain-containing protein [Gammaproteobacteria bacterium]|jgi:competence protein ComEA|nr:helix-hairpin-helix domain-containing protein [Gammaproteobacteria bacterium]